MLTAVIVVSEEVEFGGARCQVMSGADDHATTVEVRRCHVSMVHCLSLLLWLVVW